MIYSHSRLSTFEQCPYKFKLRYIDKIEPVIKDTIESFLGRIVHKTLEKLYTDLRINYINSLDELQQFLKLLWYEQYSDDIVIVKKHYTVQDYLSLAQQYISTYYHRYAPFDQTKTLGIESHITFALDDEKKYKIQGFIDRLSFKDTGELFIHDYKTSSKLPSQNQLDKDRQLALYALGVKKLYPDAENIHLIWHFLKYNKEFQSQRSEKQLKKLASQVTSLIDTIENTTLYSRKPSPLCRWCEYKPICPRHSTLYQAKEQTECTYNAKRGQQRVDQYVNKK